MNVQLYYSNYEDVYIVYTKSLLQPLKKKTMGLFLCIKLSVTLSRILHFSLNLALKKHSCSPLSHTPYTSPQEAILLDI